LHDRGHSDYFHKTKRGRRADAGRQFVGYIGESSKGARLAEANPG